MIILFLKKNYDWICLVAAVVFAVIFCFGNLTIKPMLWFDEGLNIEAAHNLFLFKKIDIQLEPGVFAESSFSLITSGYPLLAPLAGVFGLFDYGLLQARLFMLIILALSLIAVFLLTKTMFGKKAAIFAVFLTAFFSPFYANGLSVMGEIPGFIFLLTGFYFLVKKENFVLTGLFFGLAAAAKPSIYLLLVPAFIIFAAIERKSFFLRILKFAAGSFVPIALQAIIAVPGALASGAGWFEAVKSYQNPYVGAPSLFENILNNVKSIPFQSTLIYFGVLIMIVIFTFFRRNYILEIWHKAFLFYWVYGSLIFIYFLRSPGWFRYLLPLQLLTFIFIFPALNVLFKKIRRSASSSEKWAMALCFIFILIQGFNLFFKSDIPFSRVPLDVISFLNQQSEKTIGMINLPQIAAFIDPATKYQSISDIREFGKNPLSLPVGDQLDYIIFKSGDPAALPYQNVLDKNYDLAKELGKYKIYQRQ